MARVITAFSDQMMYSTFRLEYNHPNTGRIGNGTAFAIDLGKLGGTHGSLHVLVTNKHVIADAHGEPIRMRMHNVNEDAEFIDVEIPANASWTEHPGECDVCCLPLGPVVPAEAFYAVLGLDLIMSDQELLDDLISVQEVLMYGYPIGLSDIANNLPIVRRGITSSHPGLDYNGQPHGALDIACFPGSSGSPVVITREGLWLSKKQRSMVLGGAPPILLGILFGGASLNPNTGNIDIVSIPMQNQLLTNERMLAMHCGFYAKAKELIPLKEAVLAQYNVQVTD